MQGSLCIQSGVLYVGRHELTAHVRAYDLEGRALGAGFSFRGTGAEPAAVSGLDVDRDHVLWIADSASARVRAYSIFGRPCGGFGSAPVGPRDADGDDRAGDLRGLSDVCVLPGEDDDRLLAVCGGTRRHGLQLFRPDGTWLDSLRPEGRPDGRFRGLRRAAVFGRRLYACESRAGRVQVFLENEFHFLFKLPVRPGGKFEPTAVAPLADGRMLIATGGDQSALLLVDASGRLASVLAERGHEPGEVFEPEDVVVEDPADPASRIAVLDCDGERVQVFTVEGRCYGAVEGLPGEAL
jgi:hypothetical protein